MDSHGSSVMGGGLHRHLDPTWLSDPPIVVFNSATCVSLTR